MVSSNVQVRQRRALHDSAVFGGRRDNSVIGIRSESNAQVIFLRSVDLVAQNENNHRPSANIRNSALIDMPHEGPLG